MQAPHHRLLVLSLSLCPWGGGAPHARLLAPSPSRSAGSRGGGGGGGLLTRGCWRSLRRCWRCPAASPQAVGGIGLGGGGGAQLSGRRIIGCRGPCQFMAQGTWGWVPTLAPGVSWRACASGGGGLRSVTPFRLFCWLGPEARGGGGPGRVSRPPWQNPARLLAGEPPPRGGVGAVGGGGRGG